MVSPYPCIFSHLSLLAVDKAHIGSSSHILMTCKSTYNNDKQNMVSYCNVLLVYIAINSGKKLLQTSDPRVGASLTAFYLKSIFVNEASDYLVATYRTDTMALPKNFA